MDWVATAEDVRASLPDHVQAQLAAVRAELVTVPDPYFRGIETLPDLPEGCWIVPVRSTAPKGAHLCHFDSGRGWMRYVFIPRSADPQIIVEELFWQ
ncbi:hypothetical protein [Streptomyces sp. NPDC050534]|uniref:hypothetical protein n=1 Tax=Streptomyces sp. NPDC050534 TaxID=3365625 RepID=UPI0037960C45